MDLEEQLAGLCKKTRHRCWDWAQGPDSQLAHWKRLPAQRELDVCSLGGEASERGGGCSLSMTRKHCCLSQRGMESFCWYMLGVFPLSSVGLVIKRENERYVSCWNERGACHPDWKAAWMAYFYLLLRLAQRVPLAVQHSWWTARYLQPPAAPSALTQSSLLKLLSEESARFGDFTSPGYCWNPTVTLFYVNFVFSYTQIQLASHASCSHITRIKASKALLRKKLTALR